MMSPRLPHALLSHARRARRARLAGPVMVLGCAIAIATAATPSSAVAADAAADRAAARSWSPFFAATRPVAAVDPRRVLVTFDDASLGDWMRGADHPLTGAQQRAWVHRALAAQQRRLDAIAAAGIQVRVEHRYVRVTNGVSLLVFGDGAQLLRSVPGIIAVTPIRTMWPAADAAPGTTTATPASGAAAVGASAADAPGRTSVAVLDTGIDASHAAVAGHVAAPLPLAATDGAAATAVASVDEHGTAVAGSVLQGAGAAADRIRIVPVPVLERRPDRDGVESVFGDSDDMLAGLERVVDPDGDGSTADALDVAVIASTTSFAGFAGSPEDDAVRGATELGTLVVAAAGNDGASGDDTGTIGSVAASSDALAVGAVDLRGTTPSATVRIDGDGIDETYEDAPVLTANRAQSLPSGSLVVRVVHGAGGDVVDYLDDALRSRVTGAVALVAARDGVTVAEQVRAAADAGAVAVLVAVDGGDAVAGTIDAGGADIPAIGLQRADARALRDALAAGTRLTVRLDAGTERNPAFGHVAGFSSAGPRLDGVGRPDIVAPGVGMVVAGPGSSWRTVSGTSIAAGWVAGQAALVRAARPSADPATVRAVLIDSARALGTDGDRSSVLRQGGGVVDTLRALDATWFAAGGRIDFGSVAPGARAARSIQLLPTANLGNSVGEAPPTILLDDGGTPSGVVPALDGSTLQLLVPHDATPGALGGWLVVPDLGIRIPWTVTVRDVAADQVPIQAALDVTSIRPQRSHTADVPATLTVRIGGDEQRGGALGLDAVERLDVRLIGSDGRDRGSLGGLQQALPGVYRFGISGFGATGRAIPAGSWTLRVRSVPASDPSGAWRTSAELALTVLPPAKRN